MAKPKRRKAKARPARSKVKPGKPYAITKEGRFGAASNELRRAFGAPVHRPAQRGRRGRQ